MKTKFQSLNSVVKTVKLSQSSTSTSKSNRPTSGRHFHTNWSRDIDWLRYDNQRKVMIFIFEYKTDIFSVKRTLQQVVASSN